MKQFKITLIFAAVLSFGMMSCGNKAADTTATDAAAVDSTTMAVDTTVMAVDTTATMTDTTNHEGHDH